MSPELVDDKPYDERSDVWALGVFLYEMARNNDSSQLCFCADMPCR